MIQSSHKLLGALLLLSAIGVGCHRTESDNPVVRPPVDYALQPVDLLLKFEQNDEDQAAQDPFAAPQQSTTQDESQSISITRTRTVATRSRVNDTIKNNYNIFLFHKTRDSIVRHYYVRFVDNGLSIPLKNLYVGDYRLYIVVNNGPISKPECTHPFHWGCKLRHTDMSDLMSSTIPLPQTDKSTYYSLMVYSDDDFRILHEKQELKVKLKRLTSKIAIKINSTLRYNPGDGVKEYLKFESHSIINMPRQTKLFGYYRPMLPDLGQAPKYRTGYLMEDCHFTILNNMQGDGLAIGSVDPKERNSLNAPSNATCLRLYATYYIEGSPLRNISYLVYLGGEGVNNYDLQAGVEYSYTLNFKRPDFTDPRVTSFTVLDETERFKYQIDEYARFPVGAVISRPMTVEYSKIFDNDSLFFSCIQILPNTKAFKYNVYLREGETYIPLYPGVEGEFYVPTTKTIQGMDRAELKITYEQSVAAKAELSLRLSTTNGQTYKSTDQEIEYY